MNPGDINQQIFDHTLKFAQAVREFGKVIPMTVSNVEDLKQLVRASGAVGARYIAATESPNRNDYLVNIKGCSQETKTTQYWLNLIDTQGELMLEQRRDQLIRASHELAAIFSKILQTSRT
ncbi:MAG: four helix bundle protein [Bacteroidia bacterium]|nr:four helix bundle protein [Bacteroidia bacterium]